MTLNLAALREKAERFKAQDEERGTRVSYSEWTSSREEFREAATYQTILALLDLIEQGRKEKEEWKEDARRLDSALGSLVGRSADGQWCIGDRVLFERDVTDIVEGPLTEHDKLWRPEAYAHDSLLRREE